MNYFNKLKELIFKPSMNVLPGQLAFFLILSLFPLLTLLGLIGSKYELFSASFISAMKNVMPSNFVEVILPFVTERKMDGNIIFIMILGFIVASNGAHSLIITSDELYELPYENYIKRRIKAFLMTILFLFMFVFIIVFLAYGNIIVSTILSIKDLQAFHDQLYYLFVILRWPISFFFIFLFLKYLYSVAPDARIPSKFVNRGALFGTFGIVLITFAYSFYVNNFANYSLFYGGISGIIMMMIWVYLISYVLTLGIALNSSIYLTYGNKIEKKDNNS